MPYKYMGDTVYIYIQILYILYYISIYTNHLFSYLHKALNDPDKIQEEKAINFSYILSYICYNIWAQLRETMLQHIHIHTYVYV